MSELSMTVLVKLIAIGNGVGVDLSDEELALLHEAEQEYKRQYTKPTGCINYEGDCEQDGN